MSALDSGRYSVAAGCVGICQGCVDESVAYAKEREQFGRPIAAFQLVQAMLADMKVRTDAARMLVWRAGALKDAEPSTTETSIAKLYATEAAVVREHRDPGPRRRGLRRRPPRRALVPRRARDDALRGHVADPEADHRPRADRHQRARPDPAASGDRRRRRRDDGRRHRAARRPGRRGTLLHDPDAGALERGRERIARGIEKAGARAARDAPRRLLAPWSPSADLALRRGDRGGARGRWRSSTRLFADAGVGAGLRAGDEHVLDPGHRGRRRGARPRARGRDALLQPGAADEARRGHRRACSRPRAVERVRELGEAMGKRVIDAADGPGFLVNRCNRPFGLEALRCLQEGLADVEKIDRIVRLGGGFRMGPFELQDLVGIDVGFEVSKSFYELSFGEPRWRPSPLRRGWPRAGARAQDRAAAGTSTAAGPAPPDDPEPPAPRRRRRALVVIGRRRPRRRAARRWPPRRAGTCATPDDADGRGAPGCRWTRRDDDDAPLEGAPRRCCAPRRRSPSSRATDRPPASTPAAARRDAWSSS